ncbi:MAG: acyl-CoA dehydrogenase [Actinophytocola sp.]|uniref:acyl-CoA dehydrogenase family protein n=1 Tax=Actinophytocola sp. TaxID=1872138 RepID=UPI0013293652|nr:acyl-CoA dehydrogenase family protein [Actinophytocola sp.]MPZ84606.1 acyl-CoA dehydrogenase [Actinophytocola sp.]
MTDLMARTEEVARKLPPVAEAGEPGRVNLPLLGALAAEGLLGEIFRRAGARYAPTSAMALCLIREGLARHCTEAETAFALQGLGAYPILLAGQPAVVREWIPRIAAGEVAVGFALTEPGAGSDAASLALSAVPVQGGFRLSGEKAFISNAPDAAVYSVFARTSDNGSRGITAFAVPGDVDGLTGTRQTLVSPHPIGRLRFEDVFVPATAVLGDVDAGWKVAMRTLDMFRPSVGAFALGMGQAALDAAVAYTADRQAFGRPLREFQAVSHQLADVATRLHAARLLVHDAAAAYDAGTGRTGHLSAMAKLFATETAQAAVDVAIQVHGARALEQGHLLEHLYREVRAPRIYEGASEIQREIIARHLYR